MSLRELDLDIRLPPKTLSREDVRQLLHLIFEEFRWFAPVRYGLAFLNERVSPGDLDFDGMLAYFDERKVLRVVAKTELNSITINPHKPEIRGPYDGFVSWTTVERSAVKPEWRAALVNQVSHLMKLLGAPLAYAGLSDDISSKTHRMARRERYSEMVRTVKDYSEGLAGLFWKNFYGPPFVQMFGKRLSSLPPEHRKDLGDGIVLVEPYPLPGDALTKEGKAREHQLIQQLGPECFYDHERHVPPTRRPDLSSLGAPKQA